MFNLYNGIIPTMEFNDLFKKYFARSGLCQVDMAHKLNINESYVTNIKNGNKRPSLKLAKSIAQIFNLSQEDKTEFLRVLVLEKLSPEEREVIENIKIVPVSSKKNLSDDIEEAINDPLAVRALLVVHKNNPGIKKAIMHMLDCLPSLSLETRLAILALCK